MFDFDVTKWIEKYGINVLTVVCIFLVGILLIKLINKMVRKMMEKSGLSPGLYGFFHSVITTVLYIALLMVILESQNVSLPSIVAVLSVTSLAIGLAFQDILSNVASGVVLLFTKPFSMGDYVQISDTEGTVKHITLLYTHIATVDNKIIFIPNADMVKSKLINFSAQTMRRLDLEIAVSYQDDFRRAQTVLLEIVKNNALALEDPAPLIRVVELAAHGVRLTVRVWVQTNDYFSLKFDLLEEIKLRFDQEGLRFPFEQLEVTLHS